MYMSAILKTCHIHNFYLIIIGFLDYPEHIRVDTKIVFQSSLQVMISPKTRLLRGHFVFGLLKHSSRMPSWHPPDSDSGSFQNDESSTKVHNDAKTRFSWIWPFGIWTNSDKSTFHNIHSQNQSMVSNYSAGQYHIPLQCTYTELQLSLSNARSLHHTINYSCISQQITSYISNSSLQDLVNLVLGNYINVDNNTHRLNSSTRVVHPHITRLLQITEILDADFTV